MDMATARRMLEPEYCVARHEQTGLYVHFTMQNAISEYCYNSTGAEYDAGCKQYLETIAKHRVFTDNLNEAAYIDKADWANYTRYIDGIEQMEVVLKVEGYEHD
jgi:hypothetical protein